MKHDPKLAPIAKRVRFTENNVEMPFPDASWDTVTREVGAALTLSDPKTGNVGIYTAIMQNDTPGFLAVRLKVARGEITEIEHRLSTKRNLSGPPTPIGDVNEFKHDPDLAQPVPLEQRMSREKLIAHADGYFSTLQKNNGEIRGTRFSPDATRYENGAKFPEIEKGFKSGRYLFNERVRDRDHFLVDEERGIVMSRAFIDHEGVGRVQAHGWHTAALHLPRAAHLVAAGNVQDQERHDRRRRGDVHRRAVLHPLALDAQTGSALIRRPAWIFVGLTRRRGARYPIRSPTSASESAPCSRSFQSPT